MKYRLGLFRMIRLRLLPVKLVFLISSLLPCFRKCRTLRVTFGALGSFGDTVSVVGSCGGSLRVLSGPQNQGLGFRRALPRVSIVVPFFG